jgi:hypothetical protein
MHEYRDMLTGTDPKRKDYQQMMAATKVLGENQKRFIGKVDYRSTSVVDP